MLDVLEDGWIEQRRLTAGLALNLAAQLSGADVVVEAGKDDELGFLCHEVGETVLIGLIGKGVNRYTGRQITGGVHEFFGVLVRPGGTRDRTGGDDEIGMERNFRSAMPMVEGEERVRAEEQE